MLNEQNVLRLLTGLGTTLQIALISVALSIVLGALFGVLLTVKFKPVYIIARIYLETMRLLPQLVVLFIAYFGLGRLGVNIDAVTCSIVVFTLWGLAEFGDLVRGQLETVGTGQIDGARALGLSKVQILLYIETPQAVAGLIAPVINLVSRMIKTTAIVPLIGVIEVLKVGQQIIDFSRMNAPTGSLWIYGAVLVLYFLICWPISLIASRIEKKNS
jgi:polar amino acid transport system permease protein